MQRLGQLVCGRKVSRVEGRTVSCMGLLSVLGTDEDLGLGAVPVVGWTGASSARLADFGPYGRPEFGLNGPWA